LNLPEGWIVPDWPAPGHVAAFVTARAGGVSVGPWASFNLGDTTGDDPQAVAENRRRLAALLPHPPRWLKQVHGARVVEVATLDAPVEADAAVAHAPDIVCAVRIADCMPVFLCDTEGRHVGVAHAGWRGLSGGVLERTVAALGVPPAALMAFLGPAIGPDAFEVGEDVLTAFTAPDPQAAEAFRPLRPGKWLADLYALARRRLHRAGVSRIHGGGLCTVSAPERFYSYRRDRVTGRMAACIWLRRR